MFFISIVLLAGFAEAQNYIGAVVTLAWMGIETLRANRTEQKTKIQWQTIMMDMLFRQKERDIRNGRSVMPTTKNYLR